MHDDNDAFRKMQLFPSVYIPPDPAGLTSVFRCFIQRAREKRARINYVQIGWMGNVCLSMENYCYLTQAARLNRVFNLFDVPRVSSMTFPPRPGCFEFG